MNTNERIAKLEKENKFLKLQLNIIHELADSNDYMAKLLGKILYYSDSKECINTLKDIEKHDYAYNYLHKSMNVDNWEVAK